MEAFVTSTFCCPITRRLVRDPVITRYGISYERDALIRAWTNNGGIDPVAKGSLKYNPKNPGLYLNQDISTYPALRQAIESYDAR
jgi:hypothetical protein